MQRRKIDNKTLDAIGKRIVERDLLSVDEIDQIVSKPDLFDQITRRITAVEGSSVAETGKRPRRWIPAAATSFASLATLAILAAIVIDRNGPEVVKQKVSQVKVPDAAPEVARPDVPPKEAIPTKLSAGRAFVSEDTGPRIEKASMRSTAPRVQNVRPRPIAPESRAEFYPVAYSGDPTETAGGGRIIRVDLNRSALFAMGLNVPLENDHATVKADLLVGNDGVTRAVRLVE